jgi:hypothetical protein
MSFHEKYCDLEGRFRALAEADGGVYLPKGRGGAIDRSNAETRSSDRADQRAAVDPVESRQRFDLDAVVLVTSSERANRGLKQRDLVRDAAIR